MVRGFVGRPSASSWAALVAILLYGCDPLSDASDTDHLEIASEEPRCQPVDPTPDAHRGPGRPCFTVVSEDLNLLTLSWEVANSLPRIELRSENDVGGLGRHDADCDDSPGTMSCALRFRVSSGGTYTFSMIVTNAEGDQITVSDSALVHPPSPPTLLGGGHVDMLDVTDQWLTWNHVASCISSSGRLEACAPDAPVSEKMEDEWMELRAAEPTAEWQRFADLDNSSSPHRVRAEEIEAPGVHLWRARYCVEATGVRGSSDDSAKICSSSDETAILVEPARWRGPHRIELRSPVDELVLTHTADSGDVWIANSDTLVNDPWGDWSIDPDPHVPFLNGWIDDTTYRVPGERLTPGRHRLTLVSCKGIQRCSNRVDALAPLAGVLTRRDSPAGRESHHYPEGSVLGTITPPSGAAVELIAPASGRAYFMIDEGLPVAAERIVAIIITANVDVVEIRVAESVAPGSPGPARLEFDGGLSPALEP